VSLDRAPGAQAQKPERSNEPLLLSGLRARGSVQGVTCGSDSRSLQKVPVPSKAEQGTRRGSFSAELFSSLQRDPANGSREGLRPLLACSRSYIREGFRLTIRGTRRARASAHVPALTPLELILTTMPAEAGVSPPNRVPSCYVMALGAPDCYSARRRLRRPQSHSQEMNARSCRYC